MVDHSLSVMSVLIQTSCPQSSLEAKIAKARAARRQKASIVPGCIMCLG